MHINKKIIFVITKSNWGGAQRYVYDLSTSLPNDEYDVIVATGGKKTLYHKLKDAGIKVHEIPGMDRDFNIASEFRALFFLYSLFRKEKPDIIHLNSSKAGLGALAGRLARVKRIVFTMHGLAINELRPRYQKVLIRAAYFITLILCHKTITVSKALKKQAEENFSIAAKKVTAIHNGTSSPKFDSRHDARAKLISTTTKVTPDIKLASFSIGTISELHPIKGHAHLLHGFRDALYRSALPLYLFIVGDGQDKTIIQNRINDLRLNDNVFMCGHIDNAPTIMKAFDILTLPSISEGLPYVLQEAGHANLPVIASNVGGIPEIIENNKTGILVAPESSTEIAEAILKLVYEPHTRNTISANLHKKITTEFTLEQMVAETAKIYTI